MILVIPMNPDPGPSEPRYVSSRLDDAIALVGTDLDQQQATRAQP